MTDNTQTDWESGQPHTSQRLEDVAVAALEGAAADRQRALASGALDASAAIDAAGRSLLESNRREASAMADAAARWLQERAHDLTHRGPRDLIAEVDRAARDHPALFIGVAAALGAAAAAGLQSRTVREQAARAMQGPETADRESPAGGRADASGAAAAEARG